MMEGKRLRQAWPVDIDDPEDGPPPGVKLSDGRWTPDTLVLTPSGERVRVLPYDAKRPNQSLTDAVYVRPVRHPERPWQLWSSADLAAVPDEPDGAQ